MSITMNVAQRAQATADALRERPHIWTAIIILLAILACVIAASLYADAPVLDQSLAGP